MIESWSLRVETRIWVTCTKPNDRNDSSSYKTYLTIFPIISSANMETNKDTETKVKYGDSCDFLGKKSSRRTKIVIIGSLGVVLLLGAVSVYFAMRKTTPTHLVEVNLQEGETLTYKVEQQIELQGNDVQKGKLFFLVFSRLVFCLAFSELERGSSKNLLDSMSFFWR